MSSPLLSPFPRVTSPSNGARVPAEGREGEKIRTVIVDRNGLVRASLAVALRHHDDIDVVADAPRADEVHPSGERLDGAIVLLGLADTAAPPVQDVQRLKAVLPGPRILALGVSDDDAIVLACIEAGVAGYLPQSASLDDLVRAVRALAANETLCSPRVAGLLFSRVAEGAWERHRLLALKSGHLTRRELEIVALIEQGLANKEIAVELHIETQTVKNHIHNILEKLQLGSRREAAVYARERGLLSFYRPLGSLRGDRAPVSPRPGAVPGPVSQVHSAPRPSSARPLDPNWTGDPLSRPRRSA
jgi:two-component system, NarL family, nitrate/nitrite response regulator NarL